MFETGISLFFFFFKVQYLNCFLCPWWYDLQEGNVCSLSLPFVRLSRFFPVLFAVIAPAEHSLPQTSLAQTSLLASGLQICSSFQVCLIELKDFYWIPLLSLRVFLQLLVSSLWGMWGLQGFCWGEPLGLLVNLQIWEAVFCSLSPGQYFSCSFDLTPQIQCFCRVMRTTGFDPTGSDF